MDDLHSELYRAKNNPFLQEDILDGMPSCTKSEFLLPRLRRCPFDLNAVDWDTAKILGAGIDGLVWRVRFRGDEAYYALKVFWTNKPPKSFHYYAAQRECQNNAVLQMITASVEDANKTGEPIFVESQPQKSFQGAMSNLLCFSDEYRQRAKRHALQRAAKLEKMQKGITEDGTSQTPEVQQPGEDKGNDKATADDQTGDPTQNAKVETQSNDTVDVPDNNRVQIDKIPPLVKCFGWVPFHGAELLKMPPHRRSKPFVHQMKTHELSTNEEYTTIVYEYVPRGESTGEDVERVISFFYLTGFCLSTCSHMRNWRQGKLVDMSDIVFPQSAGWQRAAYRKRATQTVLNNK